MKGTSFSILLFVLGLIIGIIIILIINYLKNKTKEKNAESIIDKAKKEADKIKRDSLFETKEEIHKLKMDADREVKERKQEALKVKSQFLNIGGDMKARVLNSILKQAKLK